MSRGRAAAHGRWLVVVDFDGTVSERDMLDFLCRTHAPGAYERAEEGLLAGALSLNDCIRLEFEPIRGEHDALVAEAVDATSVRRGFAQFVRDARAAGHRLVVVSSGFEALIQPVLAREGVGDLEVISNDVRFSPEGTLVLFRKGLTCAVCGQECKRSVVAGLEPGTPVAYVGDGYSDRCAALAADRRLARGRLATYLEDEGVEFEPFDDFTDIARALLGRAA